MDFYIRNMEINAYHALQIAKPVFMEANVKFAIKVILILITNANLALIQLYVPAQCHLQL